jgi:hypothetical protein
MPDHDPIETAWRIHSAIADWTAKVDSKANFVLTIESALLVGVVALAGGNRRLSHLHGTLELTTFWMGVGALILAVLLVVDVVRPRLRRFQVDSEWAQNFIFFGHLRLWRGEDLIESLKSTDLLPMLSRQLVNTANVAWRKHSHLQISIWFLMVGAAALGVTASLK